ncbi:MAG: hypothetical protein LBS50_07440 [Prevotellaceae bacterium]|nr:hypothetical protein [Prevotellaceae bacterium]
MIKKHRKQDNFSISSSKNTFSAYKASVSTLVKHCLFPVIAGFDPQSHFCNI